ncbi:MAG: 7-carboxy-7-deazaguanine synthase QueE [bacterium]|nr:7-carboxy-7-deazaguanine synthase QueE [bacterium]
MQISEIFYSIQGEGINIGKPAIFLRLAGCHLRCTWCDTKYTWDLKSGKNMTTNEIIKEIKKHPCKHLVITGGEPLIQQNALIDLLKHLKKYYIEIETSGSLPTHLNDYIDNYNCSPKLGNSKNRNIKLEEFPEEKTNYKFVVDKNSDLKEIKEFIRKHRLPKKNVQLMPQGVKKRELAKKSEWLAEICKKENFRFTPRLHINLWGNKRKK